MRYLSAIIKAILALLFLLFFLIVSFNNTQVVTFNWFLSNGSIQLPLIVLLFLFFISGIVLGILGMLLYSWKIKRQLGRTRKEEKRLVNELAKQNSSVDFFK